MYKQRLILLLLLVTLDNGIGPEREDINTFKYFIYEILHLISFAVLGFGDFFHVLLGKAVCYKNFVRDKRLLEFSFVKTCP